MANREIARIAFIGAGQHATESLYPNIAHIPEFDLVATCDIDEARAQGAARRFGAPQWFTDVEILLRAVQPQGCCIVGPPSMHYSVGLQVLQHGVPIFVEKPPALSLEEAVTLLEAAKAHETWGMVGFMKRFAPANVLAQEFIRSPSFGGLLSLTLLHGCGPYGDGRSMLYFNGIHMIDLARFLGGEIEQLFAYRANGERGNFAVSATGQFRNGAVVQFNLNSGQTWNDCYEAVYASGAEAGLFIDASKEVEMMHPECRFGVGEGLKLFGFRCRHTVSGNMAGWWAGGHYQRGYWGELSQFAKACLGLVTPIPTLEDSVKALKIIEAMLQSAASASEVVLP